MTTRILFTLFFVALIFYTPLWMALGGITLGAFYFKNYYEMMVLGVVFDLLYGAQGGFMAGYGIMGVVGAFVVFVGIEKLKKELR